MVYQKNCKYLKLLYFSRWVPGELPYWLLFFPELLQDSQLPKLRPVCGSQGELALVSSAEGKHLNFRRLRDKLS